MLPQAADPMNEDEKKVVTFRLRCSPSWRDWVEEAARAKELSASDYVRMVVTERLRADKVPRPKPKK